MISRQSLTLHDHSHSGMKSQTGKSTKNSLSQSFNSISTRSLPLTRVGLNPLTRSADRVQPTRVATLSIWHLPVQYRLTVYHDKTTSSYHPAHHTLHHLHAHHSLHTCSHHFTVARIDMSASPATRTCSICMVNVASHAGTTPSIQSIHASSNT